MDRLNFDAQVLMTQDAMPHPLNPPMNKPLWLRIELAKLYNDAAARLQTKYAGRYIPMATIPWDDIPASIKELERAKGLGLKAVQIKGSYYDATNLDNPALFPFWEAVSALDMCCLVHNFTQGCGPLIADHFTEYPMVGTERYHRLHLGTYLGFGLDYAVACASLSLGGVLDEFPDLRFVISHLGGGMAAILGRIHNYQDKVFWGVADDPRHGKTPKHPYGYYLERLYFDTGGFFGHLNAVKAALLEIPARQLLFGTDYPQEIREGRKVKDFVAGLRTLPLPAETIQGILSENGRALLGL